MSDYLRWLKGNERLWANHSGRSTKMSEWAHYSEIWWANSQPCWSTRVSTIKTCIHLSAYPLSTHVSACLRIHYPYMFPLINTCIHYQHMYPLVYISIIYTCIRLSMYPLSIHVSTNYLVYPLSTHISTCLRISYQHMYPLVYVSTIHTFIHYQHMYLHTCLHIHYQHMYPLVCISTMHTYIHLSTYPLSTHVSTCLHLHYHTCALLQFIYIKFS